MTVETVTVETQTHEILEIDYILKLLLQIAYYVIIFIIFFLSWKFFLDNFIL